MSATLYAGLLGGDFAALPPKVRGIHSNPGLHRYRGEVEVVRGAGVLSRLCAWATRLPSPGSGPIEVEIEAVPTHERWTRHVAGHAMRSRLWACDGLLCERLGWVRFGFRLGVDAGAIVWRVASVRVFGVLPLPAAWFDDVGAREFECDGRYHFDVAAALPLAGLLVRYRGWLHVG